MRNRQLSDLQADVQKAADVVGMTQFMPLADITEYINQGWTRIYGILCRSGETHYLNQPPTTFNSVSGQSTYYTSASTVGPAGCNVLPQDMWLIKGVDAQLYSNFWKPCLRFQFEERDLYQQNGTGTLYAPDAPRYDYQGSGANASLTFIGLPSSGVTPLRIFYYPSAVRLVNAGDTIDGGNGWELYAIWYAAKEVAKRDENWELVQVLDAQMAKMEADIRAEAASRNAGLAPKLRRTRYGLGGISGRGFRGGYGY